MAEDEGLEVLGAVVVVNVCTVQGGGEVEISWFACKNMACLNRLLRQSQLDHSPLGIGRHPPGRLKCFLATAVMSLPKVARSVALTSRSASEGGERSSTKQLD